jgi:hypothetical protein
MSDVFLVSYSPVILIETGKSAEQNQSKRRIIIMKKTRLFLVITIACVMLSFLTACSKTAGQSSVTKETIFDFYNKVQMDQTKAQVDATLAVEGTESAMLKNSFTYSDPETGYGVSVLYGDKNTVTSKTLFYSDRKELAFLCVKKVTQDQADKITEGMTYDEVKTALGGDGIEISTTQIPFDGNKLSSIFIWVNPDGSIIQIVFGTDGTSDNAIFFE